MQERRPTGITILGLYFIVDAILSFIIIVVYLFSDTPHGQHPIFKNFSYGIGSPLVWVGMFFLGKGLLDLKEWARKVTVWISAIICVPLILIIIFFIVNIQNFVHLIAVFFAWYYLTRPKVKGQFK